MGEQQHAPAARPRAAAGDAHLPPALRLGFGLANPLVKVLLRSRWHSPLSGKLLLLTFTGRRSGKRYTTPVGYLREEDHLLVLTRGPWWHNLRGGAWVDIVLRGQTERRWAEPMREPHALAHAARLFIQQEGARQANVRFGLGLEPGQAPSDAELGERMRGWVLVRLETAPPTRS